MSADLLAALGALADEAIAAHERHLRVTARSAPNHRPCESGARAKFAEMVKATIAAHQPAEPDDIAAKVERSSFGTPEAQALRATVSDEHAARIVARARELEAHQSERTDTAEAARGLLLARIRVAADLTVDNVRAEAGDDVADLVASSLHDHLRVALTAQPSEPGAGRAMSEHSVEGGALARAWDEGALRAATELVPNGAEWLKRNNPYRSPRMEPCETFGEHSRGGHAQAVRDAASGPGSQ